MDFNYTTRSLRRGGQRTMLALFCVAVGVMAIVALQLVGLMINNALSSNVRDANGGDVTVSSFAKPFTSNDLSYFEQLKSNGTIENYTALSSSRGVLRNATSLASKFSILAVNPGTYPLVTPPTFVNPTNHSIASLLTGSEQRRHAHLTTLLLISCAVFRDSV
jgi:predicted lysophospholipase L1 biosynthesis ABC-type transport system permease subunit